ncbi:phage terminase large subunit family protein [Paludibacteraceae bacterium OttesenSCG-928-F17]|nr:phage terminase large subunit family protein [Paludibacteraceae bacterium OttesenSCG-928-F17]
MSIARNNLIKKFGLGLKPIPRLSVSEWADKYRILSPVGSAEPGRYRTSRTPYLRRIMDCLSTHEPYKKVVFMKGAQVGASESSNNFIGYGIHIVPAPTMMVQPTEKLAERYSKGRIDPLIEMCPELAERVSSKKSRDSKNTILEKNFSGGLLLLAGANSSAGLRSVPIRNLILDEVDAYPQDLNSEGSPVDLAIARTRTFPNKKIFIISTPTVSGLSVIEREFIMTDQNYYYVPCPFCGVMQTLEFSQLVWEKDKPHTAKYKCFHCEELIPERHKVKMLEEGEWQAKVPENANLETIGFHLNSLYSPYGWQSWAEIASEFMKSKDNPAQLKVFVNTTLGEPWTEKGEAPPFKNLYNRRENYRLNELPDDVCFLTAGVDVQKDRLELEIVGWCSDKRSYSIDYRVLEGDTASMPVWDALAKVVEERWSKGNGMEYPLRLMAIDTGFRTTDVYDFCRRYDATRVIPVKGQDNLKMAVAVPKTVDIKKDGKKAGKLRLWNVGVSFLKSDLYGYLKLEKDSEGVPPPNYCHFPEYDEHYFRGLTAEELVTSYPKGYPKQSWVKRYERNEPLDCRIYARAAAVILGLDRLKPEKLEALGGVVSKKKREKPTRNPDEKRGDRSRRRSSYWDR